MGYSVQADFWEVDAVNRIPLSAGVVSDDHRRAPTENRWNQGGAEDAAQVRNGRVVVVVVAVLVVVTGKRDEITVAAERLINLAVDLPLADPDLAAPHIIGVAAGSEPHFR